jgi:hypothetical protein
VQYDPENVVLDIERVVGRSKNKRLVEGLRVVIVRLKTNQKKKLFLPKTSIPKQPYRNYSGAVKFCAPKV